MAGSNKSTGGLKELTDRLRYGWGRDIHSAAKKGNLNKVKFILAKEPELVDSKSSTGEIVLCLAAGEGHTEMVKLLVSKGARVMAKGYDGETALHKAANGGHAEVVKLVACRRG